VTERTYPGQCWRARDATTGDEPAPSRDLPQSRTVSHSDEPAPSRNLPRSPTISHSDEPDSRARSCAPAARRLFTPAARPSREPPPLVLRHPRAVADSRHRAGGGGAPRPSLLISTTKPLPQTLTPNPYPNFYPKPTPHPRSASTFTSRRRRSSRRAPRSSRSRQGGLQPRWGPSGREARSRCKPRPVRATASSRAGAARRSPGRRRLTRRRQHAGRGSGGTGDASTTPRTTTAV